MKPNEDTLEPHRMKTPAAWYLAAATLVTLSIASRGQYAAQAIVLGLTLAIFFGTLSLRRPGADATTTHPGHG